VTIIFYKVYTTLCIQSRALVTHGNVFVHIFHAEMQQEITICRKFQDFIDKNIPVGHQNVIGAITHCCVKIAKKSYTPDFHRYQHTEMFGIFESDLAVKCVNFGSQAEN